jgi:hypothetical protein
MLSTGAPDPLLTLEALEDSLHGPAGFKALSSPSATQNPQK